MLQEEREGDSEGEREGGRSQHTSIIISITCTHQLLFTGLQLADELDGVTTMHAELAQAFISARRQK